jgi:hypothetical protein
VFFFSTPRTPSPSSLFQAFFLDIISYRFKYQILNLPLSISISTAQTNFRTANIILKHLPHNSNIIFILPTTPEKFAKCHPRRSMRLTLAPKIEKRCRGFGEGASLLQKLFESVSLRWLYWLLSTLICCACYC